MIKKKDLHLPLVIGCIFVVIILLLCILGPTIAPYPLNHTVETKYINGHVIAPPLKPFETDKYLLGTDFWGYDLLTMILYGIRYTISIALAVTLIKIGFGSLIGLYLGTVKNVPNVIPSIEKAWSYIPQFLVVYFCLKPITFGELISPMTLVSYFIFLSSVIGIPSIVSSVRKQTEIYYSHMSVEAAKILGASRHRIIWRHLFPQLKESLLLMLVGEIVFVIALMGQLALLNIFIGGTIVRHDPVIYLSITKELSGLLGQARGNFYTTVHTLYVPLTVLVWISISFSLLAFGLQKKFQAADQRKGWLK